MNTDEHRWTQNKTKQMDTDGHRLTFDLYLRESVFIRGWAPQVSLLRVNACNPSFIPRVVQCLTVDDSPGERLRVAG